MVDMTLIRPLNKGPGHSFWYQSISHRLATIHSVQTDDRRTQHCRISATVLSVVRLKTLRRTRYVTQHKVHRDNGNWQGPLLICTNCLRKSLVFHFQLPQHQRNVAPSAVHKWIIHAATQCTRGQQAI